LEFELKNFAELDLIEPLQRALADENYTTPTPIQSQTIPGALEGRDILGCAQTGTGKTAAFALPILNRLGQHHRKAAPNKPHVLVLAPTRELAIQIGESFATYGRHLRLRQVLVYGGVNQANQVRALNRGAHILVATPGRLLDLMDQGFIELNQLEVFVLDEADRMLDMGFMPALKRIISELPKKRQSLFFSATMPDSIRELSGRLLSSPVCVNVTPKQSSVERIEQQIMFVERAGKLALITKVVSHSDVERAIVFTKTKRGANMLSEKLGKAGVKSTAIHGNKSQSARQKALDAFRRRDVTVLVATDVAARGIDIDGVTHVVNYDMPLEPESYVHRIGRTGRAGAAGIAISFCTSAERAELRAIEDLIGRRIPLADFQPPRTSSADETDTRRQPRAPRNGERARASGGASRSAHGDPHARASKRDSKPSAVPKGRMSRMSPANKNTSSHPTRAVAAGSHAESRSSEGMSVSAMESEISAPQPKRKTLPKKHRARAR
jgi:ATP-dependent RNA helicase RhlE